MVRSCAPSAPPVENPGVMLGAILGVCQRHGRDKVTIIASKGIADFGAWLEQLLAEVDRQARQGDRAGRRRAARTARGLRQRPGLRLSAARRRPGRRAGARGRRARSGRPPGGADHRLRADAARPGILPLGDGDRGRRLDHRHQPVRPARCRGEQGQDPRSDHGLREDRGTARGEAVFHRRQLRALRRPEERGGAGAHGDQPDRGAQGPFRPHRRRRLCRAARLYRAQPRRISRRCRSCAG